MQSLLLRCPHRCVRDSRWALGVESLSPHPQRQHYTHNQHEQGALDMHIESFVGCPTNDNFTFSAAKKGP